MIVCACVRVCDCERISRVRVSSTIMGYAGTIASDLAAATTAVWLYSSSADCITTLWCLAKIHVLFRRRSRARRVTLLTALTYMYVRVPCSLYSMYALCTPTRIHTNIHTATHVHSIWPLKNTALAKTHTVYYVLPRDDKLGTILFDAALWFFNCMHFNFCKSLARGAPLSVDSAAHTHTRRPYAMCADERIID